MVLGGTRQENNYNTNVDIDDRKFIFDGCVRMMPSLKHAEIVGDMVGLRPGRTQVRLERDVFKTSREKNHNYRCSSEANFGFVHFSILQKVVNSYKSSTIMATVELVLLFRMAVQLRWLTISKI